MTALRGECDISTFLTDAPSMRGCLHRLVEDRPDPGVPAGLWSAVPDQPVVSVSDDLAAADDQPWAGMLADTADAGPGSG